MKKVWQRATLPRKHSKRKKNLNDSVSLLKGKGVQKNLLADTVPAKEQMFAVLNNFKSPFFGVNATWKCTFINSSAIEALSLPREKILGKNFFSHARVLEKSQALPYFLKTLKKKVATDFEIYCELQRKWYEIRVYPFNSEILFSLIDITARKELETRKDEFVNLVSHELKTPITIIKTYAQILSKRMEQNKDEKNKYFLDQITAQIDNITFLINELLDLGKIRAGKLMLNKERFFIMELVKRVVIDFQYSTDTHTILLQGSTKKAVFIDRERIGQVLINLLTNAVKYSPTGGRIIVSIERVKKIITIGVRDFGTGIAREQRKKIFERYYRVEGKTNKNITSFGLGLFICKKIIERHKGEIWVKSRIEKGSTFFFTLPVVA